MNARYGRYILVGALVLVGLAAHMSGATSMLSLQAIVDRRQELLAAVQASPVLAAIAFASVYVLVAALAIPASAVLTMAGGFLFGRWLGTGLVIVAATTGALIVFSLARSAVGEPLRRRAGPFYEKIARNADDNAFSYMLFLRLAPIFPFPVVNLTAALLNIHRRTFVVTTLIGIAPATFAYANFGRELSDASSIGDVLSPSVLLALGAIGCLALVPVLYRRWNTGEVLSAAQE